MIRNGTSAALFCATLQTFFFFLISAFLSVILGTNVLLCLIQMNMSNLFRLGIPFLLQLQPFHYSVLKSLHHFMNHPLPCYLQTKKRQQHNLQSRIATGQQAGRSSKYYSQGLFLPDQPKREAIRTEILLRLQRALRALHISISCTQLFSRILNMHKHESWWPQCWSLIKLDRHEGLGMFKLLFHLSEQKKLVQKH